MYRSLFFVAITCLAGGVSSVCFAQDHATDYLNKLSPEEWQSRVNATRERLEQRRKELRLDREKRLGANQEKLRLNRDEQIGPTRNDLLRERENKGGELPPSLRAGSTINSARFGMPTADTAGVPAGVTLTPYTGRMTIETPGAVIENVIINGQLTVIAADLTIKNCIIQTNDSNGILAVTASNLLVENCIIIGGDFTDNGILGHGTFVGNDISHVRIGIQLTDGASTVRDNYIHDLFNAGSAPHFDGITLLGGQNHVVIEHNTISAPSDHGTAEILIQNVFGPVHDVQINNNLLLGTPSYAVYFEAKTTNGAITSIDFTNNYVERGAYGYYLVLNSNPTFRNNVEWDSRVPHTR
ncbi:right-handed parallel beta-helix repeat-containing protein [Bradyrhizobium sp. GCM10028915]|uniref:right-handed parallel beta-helix repeat-containing protein n=1 Tax=Bradyrhizobium sp. GCM10028915 TaxID=3273385 RepID=UPI003609ED8D